MTIFVTAKVDYSFGRLKTVGKATKWQLREKQVKAAPNQPAVSPIAALHTERWFAGLESDVQRAMLSGGVMKRKKRGQLLFRQGDEPSGLFAIVQGQAHSQAENEEGRSIILSIYHAPEWVGFLACADGNPFTFDVVASVDSDIFFVPIPLVRSLFHSQPQRYMYLLAPQLSSLRKIYRYLISTIHLKPIERLAFRLIDFSRSPWYDDGEIRPIRGLSQETLATAIFSNRQDTNAMLQEFERRGLIRKSYGQIEVLDMPALARIARIGD
jgi:CRP-like cAMP-binding protein